MGFLTWYTGRKDLEENVRLKIAGEAQRMAIRALKYKLDASNPGSLRVREGAGQVSLSSGTADSRSSPDDSGVPKG